MENNHNYLLLRIESAWHEVDLLYKELHKKDYEDVVNAAGLYAFTARYQIEDIQYFVNKKFGQPVQQEINIYNIQLGNRIFLSDKTSGIVLLKTKSSGGNTIIGWRKGKGVECQIFNDDGTTEQAGLPSITAYCEGV